MERSQSAEHEERKKIFIGGLIKCNREQGESLIREHFKQFGEINYITLKEGFAFVEFMDEESAEKVLKSPPEVHILAGRRLNVQRHKGTTGLIEDRKVFVSAISKKISKQDMMEYFEKFGPVMTVKLVSNLGKALGYETRRGFAFILFAHEDDALAAVSTNMHRIKPQQPEVKVQLVRKRTTLSSAAMCAPGPSYSYNNNYNNYGGYNNQHQRSNYNQSYPSPRLALSYESPSYRNLYGGSYEATTSGSPMSTRHDENAEDRDSAYVRRPYDSSANQQQQQQMYNNNPYAGVGQQQQASSNSASYGRNPLGLGDYGQGTNLLSSYTSGYATAFPTGTGSSYSTYNKNSRATRGGGGGNRGPQRQ